jgi:putative glutamine amidotransferase
MIGIPFMTDEPDGKAHPTRISLNINYIWALRRAGGVPMAVLYGNLREVDDLLPMLSGLLLTGGTDVDPARYGQAPAWPIEGPDPPREEIEWKLLTHADRVGMPVFGICRGMQTLNIFRSGTLVQDISSQRPDAGWHDFKKIHPRQHLAHAIRIEPGSRVASLIGREEIPVNSFHHQAVDELGRGLEACAWSPDGIVEAFEEENPGRFVVGVQFHPEDILDEVPSLLGLFRGFVEACRSWKGRPQPSEELEGSGL